MALICILIFIFFPVLSIIFSICGYFFGSKKYNIIYAMLIALSLGTMVYYFEPLQTYDLYRHHAVVESLINNNFSFFIENINNFDLEPIPMFVCYFISKTQNINLLQFVIVCLGYFLILYILGDYRKKINLNDFIFMILTLFTFFGFNTLYFISGLWCYIAIILFFLILYLDYVKNINKKICIILCFLLIFVHNSMLFPFIILIIYKLFGSKLKFREIIIISCIFIFPNIILGFLTNNFNIDIINKISYMYNAYFTQNSDMKKFYSGTIFFIEITKLLVTFFAIYLQNKEKKLENINGFIILLTIGMGIMIPKSIVMIRFVMLIQFIGIIPLFNCLKEINKKNLLFLFLIILLTIIYIIYFYSVFRNQNFGSLFEEGLLKNIFSIIFN
jgi:hypothetical protein